MSYRRNAFRSPNVVPRHISRTRGHLPNNAVTWQAELRPIRLLDLIPVLIHDQVVSQAVATHRQAWFTIKHAFSHMPLVVVAVLLHINVRSVASLAMSQGLPVVVNTDLTTTEPATDPEINLRIFAL